MALARDAPEHSPRRLAAWNAAADAIRPVIALLIEEGVGWQEASRLVRWVYVSEAAARHRASGTKPTISRIAAATGMSRAEVSQILADKPAHAPPVDFASRSSDRIVAAWMSDPDYLEPNGDPRAIAYSDAGPNFSTLVRGYGADIPPRAMLNEMIASRLLTEVQPGRYLPVSTVDLPRRSDNHAISSFGLKMSSLGFTLLHNMKDDVRRPLYERLVLAVNVSGQHVQKLARELDRRCKTFSQAVERYLLDHSEAERTSQRDADSTGIGVLVAVIHRRDSTPPSEAVQE